MSYSVCLKCGQMVGYYDKYCRDCQRRFGLPDLREFQKENRPPSGVPWREWAEQEVSNDFKDIDNAN